MATLPMEHDDDRPVNPFAVARPTETAASADVLSSREVADIQASLVIAQRFPRDEAEAMDRILNAFARPTLAEVAMYQYARGGTEIEGLSIRAAEALANAWGRIEFGIRELEQRNGVSTVEAYAFDMQTLTRSRKVFQARHWRDTKKGGHKLTDARDIYEMVANQGARRMRSCILAVIPIDVQEAAKRQINVTLKAKVEITPELLTSLVEKFADIGVPKEALEKRIQRHIDAITPAQVLQLGKIFNSIRDGFGVASDYFEVESSRTSDSEAPTNAIEAAKYRLRAAAPVPAEPTPPAPEANGVRQVALTYADIAAAIQGAESEADCDAVADTLRTWSGSEQQRRELDAELAAKRKTA